MAVVDYYSWGFFSLQIREHDCAIGQARSGDDEVQEYGEMLEIAFFHRIGSGQLKFDCRRVRLFQSVPLLGAATVLLG